VLEVITNALRDAESLRGFTFARTWAHVASQTYGPNDFRVWKARGVLIHLMQIHGYYGAALRAHHRHMATFTHVKYSDEEGLRHSPDGSSRQASIAGARCRRRRLSGSREPHDQGDA
jgi:hypothetical protein